MPDKVGDQSFDASGFVFRRDRAVHRSDGRGDEEAPDCDGREQSRCEREAGAIEDRSDDHRRDRRNAYGDDHPAQSGYSHH